MIESFGNQITIMFDITFVALFNCEGCICFHNQKKDQGWTCYGLHKQFNLKRNNKSKFKELSLKQTQDCHHT